MAGKRLFCNRRWLNPNDPDDRTLLEQNYDDLIAKFPAFARCSRIDFLQRLADVCTAASSERASDDRAAAPSPTPDADADREESWTPESLDADRDQSRSPESPSSPFSAASSCSPAPTSCVDVAACNALAARLPTRTAPARAASESAREGFPALAAGPATGGDGGRTAWFNSAQEAGGAGAGAAAAGGAGLNAGEAVDMGLYQHWASVPTVHVDPGDLEDFGRSKSF
jgi:hypothetical protein